MTNILSKPLPHPPIPPIVLALTLAGGLPFVACAIGAWRIGPLPFNPVYVAVVYAAIILSFLGGIHWALFLQPQTPKPWVIFTSNLLALLGWISVLLFPTNPASVCLFLALGFLLALWIDGNLRANGFIPQGFYRLRQIITAIVTLSLVATAAAAHMA